MPELLREVINKMGLIIKAKPLLFIILCLPTLSQAQLQVKGLLNDENGSPLPYASVLLLNGSDSSFVRGQVSDDKGLFSIATADAGAYFISVTAIGYQEESTKIFQLNETNSPYSIGKISIREKTEQLNEVVIRADKPMFEQKLDRTIINVQSNISRAGGSALDVLQRSPGVTVDKMNSAISLSGKQGVRIMINGKISRIPMTAVVQMLGGMNAENIERIELITTPPSKYEAEGDAGMINIVMKKTEDKGTNGSLSLFAGYGRRGKYGGTLNLNSRSKNINLFGDLTSRKDYSTQYFNTRWAIPINSEINETTSDNDRDSFTGANSGNIGVDWNVGKKTTVGGLFNFFDRQWDMDALADISRTINTNPTYTILMNTIEENDWRTLTGNLNLKHDFNKDYTMSVDLDKIGYNSSNPTDYYQDFFDNLGNPTSQQQLRSRKTTGINIFTTAVDFTGRLSDRVTIEFGGKGSFTQLNNDIIVDKLENGVWNTDSGLTVYAEMVENIGAGYTSATIKASDKLDLQLGIRYEHTITNIDTETEQNVIDRNYGKWFPSIFINHKINKNNSWVTSYSRRITRPSFFQLAPFVIFNDPNNFYSGNISLLPSFTDAVKLEYRHKSILLSLQYSHDQNSITLFQPEINDNNQQVSTAQNLSYQDNFSVVLSFPIQVTKWWEIQLNGIGGTNKIRAAYTDDPITLTIQSFSFNGTQKFKISKTITAEISGFYQSRNLFGIMEIKPFGSFDLGFEKRFANSSIRVSYSDIFGTNKWRWGAYLPSENLDTSAKLDFETTIVNATYLLNFGNNKLKARKAGKTGSKDEQDRLR